MCIYVNSNIFMFLYSFSLVFVFVKCYHLVFLMSDINSIPSAFPSYQFYSYLHYTCIGRKCVFKEDWDGTHTNVVYTDMRMVFTVKALVYLSHFTILIYLSELQVTTCEHLFAVRMDLCMFYWSRIDITLIWVISSLTCLAK